MDKWLAGLKLAAEALKLALNLVVEKVPDAADIIAKAISELDSAVASGDALKLLKALNVPAELVNISQGNLDPRTHPSDGAA